MTATDTSSVETVERFPHLAGLAEGFRAQGHKWDEEQVARFRTYVAQGVLGPFMGCRDEEILLEGPAGTGKSRAALEKLHYCAQVEYPGMRGLILRKTRESMSETVLVTFEEHVLRENNPIASGPNRHNRQVYSYANGSEIVVGGLDKPAKVMSSEYDLIVVDEATELGQEAWEALLSRLRNAVMPYQQLIACCNPADPFHWLNVRPDKVNPLEPERFLMRRFKTRHEDNPVLFDRLENEWTTRGKQYIRMLERLSGVTYQRLRQGRWVAAEGAVYEDEWDESYHVVDPPDPQTIRWMFASMDWGFTNPGVLLVWAVDNDHRMYCVGEVYRRGKTIDWWIRIAAQMRDHTTIEQTLGRYAKVRKIQFHTIVVDPSEPEHIAAFHAAGQGFEVVKGNNERIAGIQHVRDRLIVEDDGRPTLMYVRGALIDRDEALVQDGVPWCTTQEYPVYAYPKALDGKPVKEEPMDLFDHGMDATRYAVMYADHRRFGKGAVRVQRTQRGMAHVVRRENLRKR